MVEVWAARMSETRFPVASESLLSFSFSAGHARASSLFPNPSNRSPGPTGPRPPLLLCRTPPNRRRRPHP